MWTSTYYGYWDYWELRHKITFDGDRKLMLINQGVTELDVQTDIYSDWKEWQLLDIEGIDNAKYPEAIQVIGGQPTVGNQFLDATYFLINGWKLKPYPGRYNITITGNLFDIQGGDIKVPADLRRGFANNITVNTNTSVIVRRLETDTSGLTAGESASLSNISGSVETIISEVSSLSASLSNVEGQVVGISGSLVQIKSILESPVTASLVSNQQQALFDIQTKVNELYRLNALESGSELTVTETSRTVANITQSIDYDENNNTTKVNRT